MGHSTGLRGKERGQELVEFALILPLLLLLMLGIFEFGYVVFARNTLSNAVREGARYGAVRPDDTTGIIDRAQALTTGLDQSQLSGTRSAQEADEPGWWIDTSTDGRISVDVLYEHQLLTMAIFQRFGTGNTLTLSAASSMALE